MPSLRRSVLALSFIGCLAAAITGCGDDPADSLLAGGPQGGGGSSGSAHADAGAPGVVQTAAPASDKDAEVPDAKKPMPTADSGALCPGKQAFCNGKCIDESDDVANCGKCGFKCPAGDTCSQSACVAPNGTKSCATGLNLCGGGCTSTLVDPLNCGSCGKQCNLLGGQLCILGQCKAVLSSGGGTDAGPGGCGDPAFQMCNGLCVELTDMDNCGGCGNACDFDTETCSGGSCVASEDDAGTGGGCDPQVDPCCGSTDACCGSSDPCCGNADPCCGSADPCCGNADPCCGSADPCCGSADPCCGSSDPCCSDPDCGGFGFPF